MEVLRERYLELLRSAKGKTDLVKVITGMRRSGKTTLMRQFRDTLGDSDNVIYLDLDYIDEDMDWHGLKERIHDGLSGNGIHYVFIDEIQDVDGWERVVAEMIARGDCDVYITGSSSKMLSSELATKISGRYTEIKLYPLSFKEYMGLYPGDRYARFEEYLRYGSLPVIEPSRGRELCDNQLADVFNTVLVRDVLEHTGSRGVSKVVSVARFLFSNIGNVTNVDNISRVTGLSGRTVGRYIRALTESFLFYRVDRYDVVGKKLMSSHEKYYPVDTGLARAVLDRGVTDTSRPLENIVFLELLRRGYRIRVGSFRDREVDFTAEMDGRVEYYQVCLTMLDNSTFEREVRSLRAIDDNYPKIILSLDYVVRDVPGGLIHRNVVEWLMDTKY